MKLLPALALLVLLAGAPPAAFAEPRTWHGPCVVGSGEPPLCTVWRGKVPHQANDGDTIDVRLRGDERRNVRVRIAGVQAMELTDYGVVRVGECHGVAAAQRLDRLLDAGRRKVRLAAIRPESRAGGRALRSVAVKVGRTWIDVGSQLITEGYALWLPHRKEYTWNAHYSRLSQMARLVGAQRLWGPEACGAGPAEGAALRLWVNANPAGPDKQALTDEYVTVHNADPAQTVDLSGWWMRDTGLGRYTFGEGTLLPPGAHITIRVGDGLDTATDRHWRRLRPAFENPTSNARALGEGAYLFDLHGDLRASMIYPCRFGCSSPDAGRMRVSAKWRRAEHVDVTNTSGAPLDLFGYRLATRQHTYGFPAGTVLQPGQRLRVHTQGAVEQDTALEKHWARPGRILRDRGAVVDLETFDGIRLACDAWGSHASRCTPGA